MSSNVYDLGPFWDAVAGGEAENQRLREMIKVLVERPLLMGPLYHPYEESRNWYCCFCHEDLSGTEAKHGPTCRWVEARKLIGLE